MCSSSAVSVQLLECKQFVLNRTFIIPRNVLNQIAKGENYDESNNKALKLLVWRIHFIALSRSYTVSHLLSNKLREMSYTFNYVFCETKNEPTEMESR